jgi:hypothetical protein
MKILNYNPKTNYIVLTFILSIIIILTANFNGYIENDTQSYLDVAKYFFHSDSILLRPILYPLILKFSFILAGENSYMGIVIIQLFFYILASVVFLYVLEKNKIIPQLNKHLLALFVLLSLLGPNTIASNSLVLPEIIPLTFILLISYLSSINIDNLLKSIAFGILLIVPALFKPLWLFLLILPLFNLVWLYKSNNKYKYNFIVPIFMASSLFISHQLIIKNNISNAKHLASTMDVNLNLAIIRCGIINGTEGTKLNTFLTSNGLAEIISKRKWNNSAKEFEEFGNIKNQIPWEYREDKYYWQKALAHKDNILIFGLVQIKRVIAFFTSSESNGNIKMGPSFLNYFYQSFYYWIHKIIVFPIFIVLSLFVLFKKEQRLIVIFWVIISATSIFLAFLTYQDQLFIRMRIAVEPILLFLTFYGCWRLFFLLKYLKIVYGTQKNTKAIAS